MPTNILNKAIDPAKAQKIGEKPNMTTDSGGDPRPGTTVSKYES